MNTEDHDDTPAQEKRWKKRAKYVCGGVAGVTLVVGVTVVVTLAATHGQARRENLIAYMRGLNEGWEAGGWIDGWTAAEEWYAGRS